MTACALKHQTHVTQLIGNGDVFSYEEWNNVLETSGADTALLARGVLIKVRLPR